MAREIVAGRDLRVVFDGQRCIHSRRCVLGRPDVFVPNVPGEWIHPERATTAELVELAHLCPSGAIAWEPIDGRVAAEAPPIVNTAWVRENGPLAFHAQLRIAGQPDGFRATLCRCGASRRKPWCDGSHAAAGFAATGEPPAKDSQPLARRDGELDIVPVRDGPLQVKGSLELASGTGRTIDRSSETWLCRCGHSKNKPWCDGSHAAAGFKADGA